ncbi:MAG: cell division protein FtsZ [Candidatus Pacebacteria bacterium]|nr:cell division protein FtsZ [Candidatus Paceibacterota bacterium]
MKKKSKTKKIAVKKAKPAKKAAKKPVREKPKNKVIQKAKPAEKPEAADSTERKVRIRVIGVGGGGGNIVSELSKRLKDFSLQKIDFLAANTDVQALRSLSRNIKTFAFGQKLTKGLGTGRDVELGERAGREDAEKIKAIFAENKDLYLIISSLGGGTGTGAAPLFAKTANDLGATVLGIFTLPFSFEGRKKMDAAGAALSKMKENLNAYMVIPNERIFGLAKEDTAFNDALNLVNGHLANSLEGLLRTVYSPGLINIDWADIRTILEGKKKVAYLNIAKSKISQNPEEFVKALLKNPILDYQFGNADNVMFNVEASKDLPLQLLAQISQRINQLAPNAKIIFGLSQNPKLKNEVKITLLATAGDRKEDKKRKAAIGVAKKSGIGKKAKKTGGKKKSAAAGAEQAIELNKKESNMDKKAGEEMPEEETNIRRNALEIKEAELKAKEKEEEDEKIFEIPAFLRKRKGR